jgi:hypothetical protein
LGNLVEFVILRAMSSPTPESILICGGCVFLLLGIVGGQFRSQYLSVEHMLSKRRCILSVVVGVFLLSLGFAWRFLPDIQKIRASEQLAVFDVKLSIVSTSVSAFPCSDFRSSVAVAATSFDGGCEFRIPRQSVPSGGRVRFWGRDPESFLKGDLEVTLGEVQNPTFDMKLVKDSSQIIVGILKGSDGHPLSQTSVSVDGYPPAKTDEFGNFKLDTHAAEGETTRLTITAGNCTRTHSVIASSTAKYIVIDC